ncbi:glycosyltransferase family 2 [Apiospora arundinis]
MTETVQPPEDAAAARAAEQTRLRKERREAKIRAGGTARLNKITGLGGGLQREPEPQAAAQPAATTAPSTTSTPPAATAAPKHDDPEEVDISQHYYAPRTTGRVPPPGDEPSMSEAQLRQMMLGFDRSPPGIGTPPSRNPILDPSRAGTPSGMPPPMPPGMEGMENDPMMQMLQKMMAGGGAPGGAGGANPFAGTGMESLLSGLGGMGGAGDPNMQQAAQAVADKTANIWRIIHAVFALGLGFYVALSTTFTGLKSERDMLALSIDDDENADLRRSVSTFFYLFSSVEAILLTSRYFLDKHRSPPSGIMWTLVGFLPAPLSSTIRHGLKYSQMFSTVRNDALVCVFVLGVCCWLRS